MENLAEYRKGDVNVHPVEVDDAINALNDLKDVFQFMIEAIRNNYNFPNLKVACLDMVSTLSAAQIERIEHELGKLESCQ